MVPSIKTRGVYDYTASYSRQQDWDACCAHVMGLDDDAEDYQEVHSSSSPAVRLSLGNLQVTNLLPAELFKDDQQQRQQQQQREESSSLDKDHWTENALNIQADLERMAQWIQIKKISFISFDNMRDDEASLIQSTVTSFAATTANDIESLRKMAAAAAATTTSAKMTTTTTTTTNNSSNNNVVQHRMGIVQILLARLKKDIVEPFGVLQKYRSRKAVTLWQNPLQCKLLVKSTPSSRNSKYKNKNKSRDELNRALGLDDDDDDDDNESAAEKTRQDQRFMPTRDIHRGRGDFMETYHKDEYLSAPMERPRSLIRDPLSVLSTENEAVFQSKNSSKQEKNVYANIQNVTDLGHNNNTTGGGMYVESMQDNYQVTREESEAAQAQMQQEALLLQNIANSDLDSVQKMESQMVSITTLLTQFSELVGEQQEEVLQIHETAKETKDNMDKGQDELVKAAEETNRSNHYMAKGIFALSCLLLLFHWLRP